MLNSTARLALPVWFLIRISVDRVITLVMQGRFGLDLRLYRAAAIVALDRGNPSSAFPGGGFFAAPPPTLLFYLPTAFVSLPVATAVAMIIGIGPHSGSSGGSTCPGGGWRSLRWSSRSSWVIPMHQCSHWSSLPGPVAGLGAALKVYAASRSSRSDDGERSP